MRESSGSAWYRNPWKVSVLALISALTVALVALVVALGNDSGSTAPSSEEAGTAAKTTTTGSSDTNESNEPTSPTPSQPVVPGDLVQSNGFVAVKIDNALGARPQIGLANLPLLIEYPVEGGITRIIAIVDRGDTGLIGPVRSLRPVDANLVALFAPAVASSGGQPFVVQDVEATGVISISPGALGVYVLGDRDAPHNFFLDLDELYPRIDDFRPVVGGISGGSLPPGDPATTISLPFADIELVYEGDEYLRSQNGSPFEVLDSIGGDGQVLTHDTVIVLFATERLAGYTNSNGVEVSTFDVIGGGELLVFSEGTVVSGTWLRKAYNRPFELYDQGGSEMGIPDGRLYMAIAPTGSDVQYRP